MEAIAISKIKKGLLNKDTRVYLISTKIDTLTEFIEDVEKYERGLAEVLGQQNNNDKNLINTSQDPIFELSANMAEMLKEIKLSKILATRIEQLENETKNYNYQREVTKKGYYGVKFGHCKSREDEAINIKFNEEMIKTPLSPDCMINNDAGRFQEKNKILSEVTGTKPESK